MDIETDRRADNVCNDILMFRTSCFVERGDSVTSIVYIVAFEREKYLCDKLDKVKVIMLNNQLHGEYLVGTFETII